MDKETAPKPVSSQHKAKTFEGLIRVLSAYWEKQGCHHVQSYDLPMGAATFHPATFLRSLGPEDWRCVYSQGCRRPADGRYGDNPFRLQHYYQMQVVLKPSPPDMQELYLNSLQEVGIDGLSNDIRFVEDNWESPTLGAMGYGWEIWINGMEVSQYTYFQKVGGVDCRPVTGEISYGLERLAMLIQDKDDVYDLVMNENSGRKWTYKQLFNRNEYEQSKYNFELADTKDLSEDFASRERACNLLIKEDLPFPAYDQVILASHTFNILEARRAISVIDRQQYILRIRTMANKVARLYDSKHRGKTNE